MRKTKRFLGDTIESDKPISDKGKWHRSSSRSRSRSFWFVCLLFAWNESSRVYWLVKTRASPIAEQELGYIAIWSVVFLQARSVRSHTIQVVLQ